MVHSNSEKYTQFIKAEAQRLGFFSCGIAKAGWSNDLYGRLF
jgi:hypothetical protein